MKIRFAAPSLALVALLLCGCGATGSARAGASSSAGAVTAETSTLNGIYRWSTTIAQTKGTAAEGAENEIATSSSLVVAPNTMTMTLQDGEWSMVTTATPRHDGGTYTADGRTLVMEWTILPAGEGPYHEEFGYVLGDDGTLVLTPKAVADPVDAFVLSKNPWTKIG